MTELWVFVGYSPSSWALLFPLLASSPSFWAPFSCWAPSHLLDSSLLFWAPLLGFPTRSVTESRASCIVSLSLCCLRTVSSRFGSVLGLKAVQAAQAGALGVAAVRNKGGEAERKYIVQGMGWSRAAALRSAGVQRSHRGLGRESWSFMWDEVGLLPRVSGCWRSSWV